MTSNDFIQLLVYFVVLIALAIPLGLYMAKVFDGEKTFMDKVMGPLERIIYRICGIDAKKEMNWWEYALSLLAFSFVGLISLFLLLLAQGNLPLNPQGFGGLSWHLAWNTAVSFTTNTNWQAYSGESTMSYLSQMSGLTVHNFASAAAGIAVVVALIRGLSRHQAKSIGNFWSDLTRTILYILFPSGSPATGFPRRDSKFSALSYRAYPSRGGSKLSDGASSLTGSHQNVWD